MNNAIKIGWRLVVIGICALFLAASVGALVSAVSDQLEYRSWGQDMEGYDYDLHDGDYGALGERLASYAPEGEQFQVYWDVADAYQAYTVYSFWQQVLTSPDASQEDLEAADRYGREALQQLQAIYEKSESTARKYIDSFAGEPLTGE